MNDPAVTTELRSPDPGESQAPHAGPIALRVANLSVRVQNRLLLRAIDLSIPRGNVLGIVGPSGAGKSTLLKAMNRLLDLNPRFQVEGDVFLDGRSIHAPGTDVDWLRTRLGIIFQQPVVFPASIADNVLFGIRHVRRVSRHERPLLVERALRDVGLWSEVRDRLRDSATRLSVGQQQRLCLARTLALQPQVVLMDEPTSALDPRSTESIEHLITTLKSRCTIVLVTHNLQQARRVTDTIACIGLRDGVGELVGCVGCGASTDALEHLYTIPSLDAAR